ncbi:hypothetical protein A4A49_64251 [Nicotiana attenuata]|uniref:Uncharacterized protein n=1 Tax=Nicotiana attenuata TaxID=49451 RepID=A0A314KS75_NICAT|nr:hypothetical protein A4A49_64251 [Nicotiana attenuata]
MVGRSLLPGTICKSRQLKHLFSNPFIFQPLLSHSLPQQRTSPFTAKCKVLLGGVAVGSHLRAPKCDLGCVYLGRGFCTVGKAVESAAGVEESSGEGKIKRKKLKGKRQVVRWLKFFRWKKKKDFQRMTAENKILFKLSKVNLLYFM